MTHDYLSTACLHYLHDRCRRTCKWCQSFCTCDCHRWEEVEAVAIVMEEAGRFP